MTSSCICIERNLRNEFRTEASFDLFGMHFRNIDVKIDTGCGYTSIPAQRVGFSKAEAYALKLADAENDNVRKQISFGVNDSKDKKENDKNLYRKRKYMELKSVTFAHSLENFWLGDVLVGSQCVKVSYDRVGNILIGMDVLEKLEIHMGESRVIGKHLFIACPKNNINSEYLRKLEMHFGLATKSYFEMA